MLGLSRWTEKGGSYRTIQRFYRTPIDWLQVHWLILTTYLLQTNRVYLLAGDEVVVSKAGKKTHGVGRFFSSIAQRPIASVSFMALSLIDVEARQSYPLCVAANHANREANPNQKSLPPKRKRGRPKGRKDYEKPTTDFAPLAGAYFRVCWAKSSGILPHYR